MHFSTLYKYYNIIFIKSQVGLIFMVHARGFEPSNLSLIRRMLDPLKLCVRAFLERGCGDINGYRQAKEFIGAAGQS